MAIRIDYSVTEWRLMSIALRRKAHFCCGPEVNGPTDNRNIFATGREKLLIHRQDHQLSYNSD
jgi:hypothetical protein